MKDFWEERKLIIIVVLIAVGFIAFAAFRRPTSSDTANPFTTVNIDNPMTKGSSNAKVSVIQYSDFICPSCSYFSTQIMPTIQKNYIDTGKVKFEFRPMAFIADGSTQGGMGAYCAIDQKKFWGYHDAVYDVVVDKVFVQKLDPKKDVIFTSADIKQIAASAGLDATSFNSCMDSKQHLADITNSTAAAQRNGVTGTPYILVNGQAYKGDVTLAAFEAFIKAQL